MRMSTKGLDESTLLQQKVVVIGELLTVMVIDFVKTLESKFIE